VCCCPNRNQLVVGLREVSKQLQNNNLSLLLLCSSLKPVHLTQHILLLASNSRIRAARVPDLNATLVPLLSISSATAIGVRRDADHPDIKDFTDEVSKYLQPLSPAWVSSCSVKSAAIPAGEVSSTNRKRQSDTPIEEKILVPTTICINRGGAGKRRKPKRVTKTENG